MPQVAFPGLTGLLADAYEWTLPTGWSWEDGSTANPRVFNSTSANNPPVRAIPAPGIGGWVRVRALDAQCGQLANRTLASNAAQLLVVRPEPTIRITTTPFVLNCGNQQPITLRAAVDAQGCSNTSVVEWSIPAGWTPANPTGAVVTVTPTGTQPSTTQITARVTMNCSPSRQLTSSALTFVYDPRLAEPTLTSSLGVPGSSILPTLCNGSSATFTAQAPGATEYYWQAAGGLLLPGGQTTATTSANSIGVTAPASGLGTGSVTVTARNPGLGCQESSSAPFRVSYGVAPVLDRFRIRGFSYDYETHGPVGGSSFLVYPGHYVYVTPEMTNLAGETYAGATLEYQWQTAGPANFIGGSDPAQFVVEAPQQPYQTFTVSVRRRNACGWGPWGTATLHTLNADAGEDPFRLAAGAAPAHPNPARGALWVPAPAGAQVLLLNGYQQVVARATAGPGPVRLDVAALPPGLYQLHVRHGKRLTRQTVSVR